MRKIPIIILLAGSFGVGCGGQPTGPPRLRVAAAADLQQAMPVLIAAFRLERKSGDDVEVDVTFGSSGQLAEQIRQGAPFDVFLSANRRFVERLVEDGSVKAGSVRPYARGSLVLVANEIINPKIRTLDDLKGPGIKWIAIANPETAPYGMAAKQALERAGLWDALKPKLVPAESVRVALQFVQSANAEVGFVGRSLAEVPGVRVVSIPVEGYDPIIQCLGLVARSERPDDAAAFADFLVGESGRGILRKLGFGEVP